MKPPCPPGEETPYTLLIRQDWETWYPKYLQSSVWQAKRERVLRRDKHTCQTCRQQATEVHHQTYQNVGNESLTELVSLCQRCHRRIHKVRKRRRSNQVRRKFRRRW